MSDADAMEAVGDGSAKQPDQPAVILSAGSEHPSPGTSPHQRPPLVQIQRPSEQEEGSASDTELVSPVESAEFVTSEEDFQDAVEENPTGVAENGKTRVKNGGEIAPEKEWVPPDDSVKDKIIKQVEFYFSDANITKDAFLLKHVKRNKEGYVSIKLLTSFKKVKSLTKDWRSVCYSLRQSSKLEVNEEGTKVKRSDPLPDPLDIDDSCHSRTIVVANLPNENPTIESINEQFKHCGEIALIRILRPGKPMPTDVRKHMDTHFEVHDKLCALVEFEQAQGASKAVKTMRGQDNWRSGLHVSILEAGSKKEKKKKDQQMRKEQQQKNELSPGLRNVTGGDGTGTGSDGGPGGDAGEEKKKKRRRRKKKGRVDELTVENDATGGTPSSSDIDVDSGASPSPNRRVISRPVNVPHGISPTSRLSPSTTPKSSPCASPHGSPRQQRKYRSPLANSHQGGRNSGRNSPSASPEMARRYSGGGGGGDQRRYSGGGGGDQSDGSGSNASSPWVQRRRLLAAQQKNLSPAGSPLPGRKSIDRVVLDGISRLPRGPNDLGGFYGGKGRGKPRSTSM